MATGNGRTTVFRVTVEHQGVNKTFCVQVEDTDGRAAINAVLSRLGMQLYDFAPVRRLVMLPPDRTVILPEFNEPDPPGSNVHYWWLRSIDWKIDDPRRKLATAPVRHGAYSG